MAGYPQMLQDIRRGRVASAYYLYGEELLVEEALNTLLETLVPAEGREFNLEMIQGGEGAVEAILGAAKIPPIFSPRRVIFVKDADQLGPTSFQELALYLENPMPTTTLILVGKKPDARTRFVKILERKGRLLLFEAPRREALKGWLRERASNLGKTLAEEALDLLIELVGEELRPLRNELEKVCLFAGEGTIIQRGHVEILVGEQRTLSVFQLVEAVGQRDVELSLRCLLHLLEAGEEPPAILGMLARQVRLLLKAQELQRRGSTLEELQRSLGIYPRYLGSLLQQAKTFPRIRLQTGLARLLQADGELKGGGHGRLVLERLIVDLCRG
ncbi:MAG: DNA polymerase III subunit delta [candidate division NC10 bacterium]|nr:DNA polymerase III subunit delta [candidate division NC10 bacterium]